MTVYASHGTVHGACGVGVVWDFSNALHNKWHRTVTEMTKGGCGWICAGFIEGDKVCDEAFLQMSNKFKLMYRTPTRKNINSGNEFYFAIFDASESGVPIGFDEYED